MIDEAQKKMPVVRTTALTTLKTTDLSKVYFSSTPVKRGYILRKSLTIWLQTDFKKRSQSL